MLILKILSCLTFFLTSVILNKRKFENKNSRFINLFPKQAQKKKKKLSVKI